VSRIVAREDGAAVSIQDVARQAGVSIATVSRTFNLPGQVAPATRDAVRRIAQQVGYVPNRAASTLRSQRSKVVGVMLPTLLNPVFAECLDGIATAAHEGGYSILPVTTDYRLEREERAVDELLARSVDGILLVVSSPDGSKALDRIRRRRLPYVLMYNRHPAHPCVCVDGERAVAELVGRLARLGHRRIAMVSGRLAASDRAQQRHRGYLAGMRACGLASSKLVEIPFLEADTGRLVELLRNRSRPTALVCSNDLLAIRAIRAASLAGLSVPQDLSVVGFDGIALGEELMPMLTTIVQPNRDIGRRSVQLMLDACVRGAQISSAASMDLPHSMREGESCAPAPVRRARRATAASRGVAAAPARS
jgi:DNA-binding LacI/PurR family transcriptional regulator